MLAAHINQPTRLTTALIVSTKLQSQATFFSQEIARFLLEALTFPSDKQIVVKLRYTLQNKNNDPLP